MGDVVATQDVLHGSHSSVGHPEGPQHQQNSAGKSRDRSAEAAECAAVSGEHSGKRSEASTRESVQTSAIDAWIAQCPVVLPDAIAIGIRAMVEVGLFKRLESSGGSFILSLERHILRNALAQHALDNGLPIPIGKSDFGEFDPSQSDGDAEPSLFGSDEDDSAETDPTDSEPRHPTRDFIRAKAAELYALYRDRYATRFRWLPSALFTEDLKEHLRQDSDRLLAICDEVGPWQHTDDAKLNALTQLLRTTHPTEKVLVFTQYADTADYLTRELSRRGIADIAAATGNSSDDPTTLAYRFSPRSNQRRQGQDGPELRVLIATDVLSEGQNLQDAHVVVNYDLPWAIIRLIQRAGRVDRIGQQSPTILCYSFLPAEGVDTIIRLRTRIRARLRQNAEVVAAGASHLLTEQKRIGGQLGGRSGARFRVYDRLNGVVIPLPPEIAAGVKDVSKRGGWNKPAPEPFGLPTETWREHVARRERCLELRRKLAAGEVSTVNDVVTLNLDIRQFAGDVIDQSEGPDLLRAVWKAVESVTVLDPTCGSGAFLFAALNILEPLYEACLDRMGGFLDSLARETAAAAEGKGRAPAPDTFADFKRILDRVADHPNRRYFILKSIIVNNLYGVDIMEEACEICKLRLFLKLVAQVEEGAIEKIEPLPDIDFNIRSGNTLVGFATLDAVRKSMEGRFDFGKEIARIETQAVQAAEQFTLFRQMQTSLTTDSKALAAAKAGVRAALQCLNDELDEYLASEYGIDPAKPRVFASWRQSHEPFHWLVDFYGIMTSGGFDVIVGNPPYVEWSKVTAYDILPTAYSTRGCGNIYSCMVERALGLLDSGGRLGLIVPLSIVATSRTKALRGVLRAKTSWVSCYDMRPSSLFEGVAQRLSILLATSGEKPMAHLGGFRRWSALERPFLLQVTRYAAIAQSDRTDSWPKLECQLEADILKTLGQRTLQERFSESKESVYVHRIVRYFVKALDFVPLFISADGKKGRSEDYKPFGFQGVDSGVISPILNSSVFYWFWRLHGDGFHCGYADVLQFPLPTLPAEHSTLLQSLQHKLMTELKRESVVKTITTKRGVIKYQEFRPSSAKPILDDIDLAFAEAVGMTPEQVDWLLNYDIKYRMGDSGVGEAEDEA